MFDLFREYFFFNLLDITIFCLWNRKVWRDDVLKFLNWFNVVGNCIHISVSLVLILTEPNLYFIYLVCILFRNKNVNLSENSKYKLAKCLSSTQLSIVYCIAQKIHGNFYTQFHDRIKITIFELCKTSIPKIFSHFEFRC